jgi:hypothetical protein
LLEEDGCFGVVLVVVFLFLPGFLGVTIACH